MIPGFLKTLLFIPIFGQIIFAQSVPLPTDSLVTSVDSVVTTATHPKQKAEPIVLHLHTYSLSGGNDSSAVIYDFANNLTTSYYGLADAFNREPAYYILDFLVMGEPRFVAPVHLLPHQSAVFYEGLLQNDGLNGMFNTRLLSLDAVDQLEAAPTEQDPVSQFAEQGINISGRQLNFEQAYSRIMFRQGDFGYTDLDLQFAKRFRDNLSIQLSGLNRLNDLNNYQGTIYQGAINFQPLARLTGRLVYRQNHELLSRPQFTAFQNFRYKEFREDASSNWTYQCNEHERWRLRLGYSAALRTNRYDIDSVKIRYRFRRFSSHLDRNLRWGASELLAGISAFQDQVWGSALGRDFTDSQWLTRLRLHTPFGAGFYVQPEYVFHNNFGGQSYSTGSFKAGFRKPNKLHLALQYRSDRRTANRVERSFAYGSYQGNFNIKDEKMYSLLGSADWQISHGLNVILEGGQRSLQDEIRFTGSTFLNFNKRSFSYVTLKSSWQSKRFGLSGGGQISSADIYLAPQRSGWLRLDYRDYWLNKALYLQGHVTLYGADGHNTLRYNRYVERFYFADTREDGYYTLQFKISGTVRDAQFYMAMDNALSTEYQIIDGYPQLYRRVRFGLNWELWN